MKKIINHLAVAMAAVSFTACQPQKSGAMAAVSFTACQPQKSGLTFEHQGDTLTIVHITNPSKYLILPIQESCNEGKVKLDTGSPADMAMDVRLAVDSVEYYVPFALPQGASGC